VEIAIDDTNSDIVSGRFDAGIRVGHRVERDMTILRIGDAFRILAVAAPAYLQTHAAPVHPRDLHSHNCVRYRSPWDQALLPWEFTRDGEHIETGVEGSLIVNDVELMQRAVLDGVGVGYLPEQMVAPYLAQGRLAVVLQGWSRAVEGVFLYHPSRRQKPMPLMVFLRFIEEWRKCNRQGALGVSD
jgi:DNA-binding transcriptional LysR family regulator